MITSLIPLLLATSSLVVRVSCNKASPPENFITLALAASKASYIPKGLLSRSILSFRGYIQENAGTIPNIKSFLFGTLADLMPKPNVFSVRSYSILQTLKNVFSYDNPCTIGDWKSSVHASKESRVIKLTEGKVTVFAFRGTDAYSLRDMQNSVIISQPLLLKRKNVAGKSFSVHNESLARYQTTAKWFESEYSTVPADHTVILTGYDIGGSQAFVAALMVKLKLNKQPDAVITFGAPTVGDLAFNNLYRTHVGCDRTVSITVIQDIVTRFPVGAIRPCGDTPVDGGVRREGLISKKLKKIFLKNFPVVVPLIAKHLLPADLAKSLKKTFPKQKQEEFLGHTLESVDKMFETMFDLENSHHLYNGYEHGIKKAYEGQTIDYGCNRKL